jgi:aminomethyltransferase
MNVPGRVVAPIFETPFERAGIVAPGLPILPHGTERHPIPGGGSRAVPVAAGDEIAVLDREGLQAAELVLFAPDGRAEAAFLRGPDGVSAPPDGLRAGLLAGDASAARMRRALAAVGFDLDRAEGVRVDGEGRRAGDTIRFVADIAGLLIVAAPGGPMAPDAQDPPTELVLYVRRARPGPAKGGHAIPDPLADPLQDLLIQPGEARGYEVRKGQLIQILDVQGRECSDFQAFSLRALDAGREREIDPTTTRSLTGRGYPAPGLLSKYFDVDHNPLVEIVADTCGRHDTFGLACTARYYEDLGYPGHVNCSDNMNADLARWGVGPRGGWPAINFFFNTMLDATNAIGMDEPWSRPGDYVLLRALDDLLCVSTACPCDVDPANGWNPTEISVRSYDAATPARRSVGWRIRPEDPVRDTRETGFHACFARHTRDFVEYNGYWLANAMTGRGAVEEYWACRERAAIMDLSPLRKVEVTGPDAEDLMDLCLTRNVRKLSDGQVVYSAMCYEHGGMIDDGTLFRLGAANFRWIGGADASGLWLREQAEARGLQAWVRDSTEQLCNVAVQGPMSRDILAPLFWTPPARPSLEELGWFRFTVARLGGLHGPACVISRTGYSGELGYEIFCHPRDATAIFDAIWAAGEPMGLAPLGLAALDMLRIEAGLVFAGSEFCDRTDPFEAGIGFTVPLKTKEADFIGRDALLRRRAHPQRRLVGLEIEGGTVPASGDCLHLGRAQVGEVTSAMRSPWLRRTIALARIDLPHDAPGTALEVGQLDGQQKRLRARVVPIPHFDPTKSRVKGDYPEADSP